VITPFPHIDRVDIDLVALSIAGNVFVEFSDPVQAAYGSFNPLYAVRQNAQSSMRAAIGHLELDEILHAREEINNRVHADLSAIEDTLGMKCKRYEITDIIPDRHIAEAMDKQAAAERSRREQIKGAEGDKQSAVLKSEGFKIKLINESEGEMIRITNEAEANKTKVLLAAQAEVYVYTLYHILYRIPDTRYPNNNAASNPDLIFKLVP